MDKSDFNILFNNLKNLSNDELNNLTLNIIGNNNNNNLINKFAKKYNTNEIINGINKINYKLFGGEDDPLKEGIDEADDLKVELDAARNRIDTLVEENRNLREAGNDRKNIMQLRQRQAKEKSELARTMTNNKKRINQLTAMKKQTDLSAKKANSAIKKMQNAKKNHDESLIKVKAAQAKLKQQKAQIKDADTKLKAKIKDLAKNKAIYERNMAKLKKLERNSKVKQRNLEDLERVAINQQKKADALEKQAQASSKRVEKARTKLKLQSQDFQKNKSDAIAAIQDGFKRYKEYVDKDAVEDKQASTDIKNNLLNTLKAISKIRTRTEKKKKK